MAWITELIHPKFGGTRIHKRIWNIYYLFYLQLNHCHLPTQHHWTLTKMSPNFGLMSAHYVAASHSAWIDVVLGLTTNPVESIRGSKELSWYWLKDLPNLRHVQRIFCWKKCEMPNFLHQYDLQKSWLQPKIQPQASTPMFAYLFGGRELFFPSFVSAYFIGSLLIPGSRCTFHSCLEHNIHGVTKWIL